MKFDNPQEYTSVFKILKESKKLKKLTLNMNLKPEMLDILNKNLHKEASFKYLSINFMNPTK